MTDLNLGLTNLGMSRDDNGNNESKHGKRAAKNLDNKNLTGSESEQRRGGEGEGEGRGGRDKRTWRDGGRRWIT